MSPSLRHTYAQPDPPRARWMRWLWPGIVALIASGVLYACAPRLAGFVSLQRGAAALTLAEQAGSDPTTLAGSIADLRRAAELLPDDPLPLRYLARAYRQSGRLDEAIATLEQAAVLAPQSLLIRQELLLAYKAAGRPELAALLEAELGYVPEQGIAVGDAYLAAADAEHALLWYDRVFQRWPEYKRQLAFRRLLAAIASNDPRAPALLHQAQLILPDFKAPRVGTQKTVVAGAELRWVEDVSLPDAVSGTPLNYPHGGSEGVFWWSGRGSVILEVDQASTYLVRITIRNGDPPPVEVAFGANGQPVHYVSLTDGDDTWSIVEIPLALHPPLASLDVWFLNNDMVNGRDRNAVIGQIEIQKAHRAARIQADKVGHLRRSCARTL